MRVIRLELIFTVDLRLCQVGDPGVLRGLNQAVLGMVEQEEGIVVVPPTLGYTAQVRGQVAVDDDDEEDHDGPITACLPHSAGVHDASWARHKLKRHGHGIKFSVMGTALCEASRARHKLKRHGHGIN